MSGKYQSHFVVVYDHETGKFEIDNGTTDCRFPDGYIFDGEEWVNPDDAPIDVMDDDMVAHEALIEALNTIQILQ